MKRLWEHNKWRPNLPSCVFEITFLFSLATSSLFLSMSWRITLIFSFRKKEKLPAEEY